MASGKSLELSKIKLEPVVIVPQVGTNRQDRRHVKLTGPLHTRPKSKRIKEKIEAEMKPAKVDHYLDPRKEKRRNG